MLNLALVLLVHCRQISVNQLSFNLLQYSPELVICEDLLFCGSRHPDTHLLVVFALMWNLISDVLSYYSYIHEFFCRLSVKHDGPTPRCLLILHRLMYACVASIKPAFHNAHTDSDSSDMPTSLRPTSAIYWSYSCGKLNDMPTFCDDPREDVGEDVGVGVVECGLNQQAVKW